MKLSLLAVSMSVALSATAQQGVKTVDAPYVPVASVTVALPFTNVKTVDDVIGDNHINSLFNGRSLPMRPDAQTWAIEATDMRLVDAFSRWAKKAGVQLRWDAARHVEIGAIDIYEGDVTQAMISALSSPSIANSDFPLEVCFYPNRPALARVTRRGEQWRDCPLTQAPTASISSIQK